MFQKVERIGRCDSAPLGKVSKKPGEEHMTMRFVLLLAAVLLGSAAQGAQIEVVATGATDNTFVTNGDPCGNGLTGGNACNDKQIIIRLVIDTGSAPPDQEDLGNHALYRRAVMPGFITGNATINGRVFKMPKLVPIKFDQSVEIFDNLDGGGFGVLDRVQYEVSGKDVNESFEVSPNVIMTQGTFTGDLLDSLGKIAGSPLVVSGTLQLSNGAFSFKNATGEVQGQYRISQVAFSFLKPVQSMGLSDIDNSGSKDLAVLRGNASLVELRGGLSGVLLGSIGFFDSSYTPVSAVALPDSDGNGVSEIAVLAFRNSDFRGVVEIRNVTGAPAMRRIGFAAGFRPLALAVVEGDADNNGIVELAVLSRRNSDGLGRVEVKNAYGLANPVTIGVGVGFVPIDLGIVPDADKNGVPEVAVLTFRNSDGQTAVEIRNAAGPINLKRILFTPARAAIDLAVVNDADGNTVPEVAVLSSGNSDGRNSVELRNAAGAAGPVTVLFAAGLTSLAVETVADADGNSVPELAVLSKRDSDGRVFVGVRNAAGGTQVSNLLYPAGFTPRDLTIFKDIDSNLIEEAGALLIRDSDGRILVQSRNVAGVLGTKNYWFSP